MRLPALGLMLLWTAGCALVPQLGPAPSIGPPPPLLTQAQVDSVLVGRATADSAAAELNRLILLRYPGGVIPMRTLESADRPSGSPGGSRTPPVPNGPAPGADADSIAAANPNLDQGAPSPDISIDLPPQELNQLVRAARSNLSWADSMAQVAALRPLPARERDKLETAFGLVRQGREALDRGDIRAAANLAYKARLLVEEVVPR